MRLYENKDWLYRKYRVENLPVEEIAQKAKCGSATIYRWLRRFYILRRTNVEGHELWLKQQLSGQLRGKYHHSWRGGRRKDTSGYILIYSPNHPNRMKGNMGKFGGYMFEHRLVMEKYISRYLHPWETVHHINGIRDDNRRENLELLPSKRHNKKVQEIYKENQSLKNLAYYLLVARCG